MTTKTDQNEVVSEYPEFDQMVRELDAILEAWFMAECAPALDQASRSREQLVAERAESTAA
jgi:hypothetical protein